jgi:hypothetical protein
MAFRGPDPAIYFLVSALAAPGFGFTGALGTVWSPPRMRVFGLWHAKGVSTKVTTVPRLTSGELLK